MIERAFLVRVEAFAWNCPQHITPRHTSGEIARDPVLRGQICAEAQDFSDDAGTSAGRTPHSHGTGPEANV